MTHSTKIIGEPRQLRNTFNNWNPKWLKLWVKTPQPLDHSRMKTLKVLPVMVVGKLDCSSHVGIGQVDWNSEIRGLPIRQANFLSRLVPAMWSSPLLLGWETQRSLGKRVVFGEFQNDSGIACKTEATVVWTMPKAFYSLASCLHTAAGCWVGRALDFCRSFGQRLPALPGKLSCAHRICLEQSLCSFSSSKHRTTNFQNFEYLRIILSGHFWSVVHGDGDILWCSLLT